MEEKNNSSFTLKIVVFLSVAAFVGILMYSELDRKSIKASQESYQSKINAIQLSINQGNCSQASQLYLDAKQERANIDNSGLYYSLESHAKQAHAIDIAECYADQDKFPEAIKILDMEEVHDPDYLHKAASIYERAGDVVKAEKANALAEKFEK